MIGQILSTPSYNNGYFPYFFEGYAVHEIVDGKNTLTFLVIDLSILL